MQNRSQKINLRAEIQITQEILERQDQKSYTGIYVET